ncbi:molecular chaperone [Aeromonas veronii]|uniref:molecular chaperone n=1 Tax=Aeromonas veronii TaxID=654 RepID=UPI001115AD7E|nr:molecular chaperone [Aeromonas veronii]TNI51163.1 molecular chaperone [Aeromonas veronii]
MFIGFDYGTSNCAVAVMEQGSPRLLNLGPSRYLPSTLHAPHRDAIAGLLAEGLADSQQAAYLKLRGPVVTRAQAVRRQMREEGLIDELSFGSAALERYLEEPDEGYYIKSPKSFLGAYGLKAPQIALFEDIVCAMMLHVRQQAEQQLGAPIRQAVIGRPVNFQGLAGEESNRQAIAILSEAARIAGFEQVEFLYEPVAAGFEFEARLTEDAVVLVVDIGGGTTDCSMLRMGPSYRDRLDRTADLLGHSGQRIGGNDFDIRLTVEGMMPLLGMHEVLKTGKPLPHPLFWDAAAINDVSAQSRFYSLDTARQLQDLQLDSQPGSKLGRLANLRAHKLSHQLVWRAEQGKIALSEQESSRHSLSELEKGLEAELTREQLAGASALLLEKIGELMDEAIAAAGVQPDRIFVTGGSARSPLIASFIRQKLPSIPLEGGDDFGSVAAGLARYAERLFAN